MKRKIIVTLLSLSLAGSMALGLAACNPGGSGGGVNQTPPPRPGWEEREPDYVGGGDTDNSQLEFELNGDGQSYYVKAVAENLENTDISIPREYNGLPVTAIGDSAFLGSSVTSVKIRDSITSIGDRAFDTCSSLVSISIPGSVKSLGLNAFANCIKLRSVKIENGLEEILTSTFESCTELRSIVIPDSVEAIGDSAFYSCSNLRTASIGDGVLSIGTSAFEQCVKLEELTMGNSVETIESSAFEGCSGLKELKIPDSVESIGIGALTGCSSLEKLTVPFVGGEKEFEYTAEGASHTSTDTSHFAYIFGAPTYAGQLSGKYVPDSLKTLTITGGKTIDNFAFYHCSMLETVTIGEGVEIIGDAVFGYAITEDNDFKALVIGKNVKHIGRDMFGYATTSPIIYYMGNAQQWNDVDLVATDHGYEGESNGNDKIFIPERIFYYSETTPDEGNFWHYVDGEITVW